jgi:hypothetical protein
MFLCAPIFSSHHTHTHTLPKVRISFFPGKKKKKTMLGPGMHNPSFKQRYIKAEGLIGSWPDLKRKFIVTQSTFPQWSLLLDHCHFGIKASMLYGEVTFKPSPPWVINWRHGSQSFFFFLILTVSVSVSVHWN